MLIDIEALLAQLDGPDARLAFDLGGGPLPEAEYPDVGPALLVVGPVHEAVKWVVADRVAGAFDREALWSVSGFVLTRGVLEAARHWAATTPSDLIGTVTDAGYEWVAVSSVATTGTGSP